MKKKSGLQKNIEVLLNENLMTSLIVPMMTCLWDFINLFLASTMVVLKILMGLLMVPMMALLRMHKWKLYLNSLMVLTKANLIASSMVQDTCHTEGKHIL